MGNLSSKLSESNAILPPRPEERIPVNSQAAAAPVKTSKPSLPVKSKSISSTSSRHRISQVSPRIFKCTDPGCNYTTKYEFNLKRHSLRHGVKRSGPSQRSQSTKCISSKPRSLPRPTNERFQCSQCSYSTVFKFNLKRHFATHSNDQTCECNYCEYRSQCKLNMKTHEQSKHSGVPRIIQGQKKMSKVRVMKDMKTKEHQQNKCQVDEEQAFSCTFPGCSYRSKWSQWVKAHERRAHSFTRFQSKAQKKTVQASKPLKSPKVQFVKVTQGLPSTKTPSSAKMTPTNEIPASKVKVKCPKCELKCHPGNLQRHLRVHSNEKPFGCSVNSCNYRTRWPTDLMNHLRRHGEVANKSTPVLEKSSHRQSEVGNNSIVTSQIAQRFKCPHCDYHGATRLHVNLHLNTHGEIPQLDCPEPGSSSSKQDDGDLIKRQTKCSSGGPLPTSSSRPTRTLHSVDKRCQFGDCGKKPDVGKHDKSRGQCNEPAVMVDQPEVEVDEELSLLNDDCDEENKETFKEASTELVEPSDSVEFACTLCDFVGYSEDAAWDHAKCHRQSIFPNDELKGIPLICLD